jgi:hypothetical protein
MASGQVISKLGLELVPALEQGSVLGLELAWAQVSAMMSLEEVLVLRWVATV